MKPTVTYTSNYAGESAGDNGAYQNINVTASSTLNKSTISETPDYPWSPYYVTSDEFFDILRIAFEDTYGSDHRWHPEDLYINVSCVLEIVSNTLANMVRIKSGRELHGVKEG